MPIRRTYSEIYRDGQLRLKNNTPVNNFNPQGTTKAFLDILSIEMDRFYNNIDYVYKAIDPTVAIGNDLDKIGFLVGERRSGGVTAVDYSDTNFYFYIDTRLNWNLTQLMINNYSPDELDILFNVGYIRKDAQGNVSSLNIPKGLVVSNNDGSINYTIINEAVITDSKAYVGIIATGAGPDSNVGSNVLVGHSLINIPELRKIANYIRCSNRYPIQNGRYSLTDEEFRYNISTSKNALTSNELAIRKDVLSVPGIRDILFEKNRYGNGTINIIIEGISPLLSNGLIMAVKEKVQQTLSYGDVLFVDVPKYLGVELNFNIVAAPGTLDPLSLRDQAKRVVVQYINDIPIGGEIVWNQLVSQILGINGVMDFIPNVFKYGIYDSFNKINKYQIALRFINQKAKYNEKWYTDSGLVSCCVA